MLDRSFVFVALCALAIGCSTPAREDAAANEDAVQGGTIDTKHTFVVGIATAKDGWCTGTLIASNVVLTARYCVSETTQRTPSGACDEDFTTLRRLDKVFVTTATHRDDAATHYRVKRVEVPEATSFCGNDIALLVLAQSIPTIEAIPATPAIDAKLTERVQIGDPVVAAGYGNTSATASDFGTRRILRDAIVQCLPGDATSDCLLFPTPVTSGEFNLGGGMCNGDSGAAVFESEGFDEGRPRALGVLSRYVPLGDDCRFATYTRIDVFADFLREMTRQAAGEGNSPAPEWTVP